MDYDAPMADFLASISTMPETGFLIIICSLFAVLFALYEEKPFLAAFPLYLIVFNAAAFGVVWLLFNAAGV